MPYYLPLPTGKFAEFDDSVAVDDARKQLYGAYPQMFPEQVKRDFEREAAQEGSTAVGRGFRAGYERAAKGLGLLSEVLGQRVSGTDDPAAIKQAMQNLDDATRAENPHPTGFDDVKRGFRKSVWDGIDEFSTWTGELLGGSAPVTVGTAGGALLGGAAGTPLGPGGQLIGGLGGATAVAFPSFLADNVARQIQEGAVSADDVDLTAAALAAGGQTALNNIGGAVSGLLGPTIQRGMIGQLLNKVSSTPTGRFVAGGLTASQIEGFTEASQQALERMQAGLDPFDSKESVEAYLGGAVMGFITGGGAAALGRAPDTTAPTDDQAMDADPVEQPIVQRVPLLPEDAPLALPAPEGPKRTPVFDMRPEPEESPEQYAERAIRVAGADFPQGPYRVEFQDGAYQVVSEDGKPVGNPAATADQAQTMANTYNANTEAFSEIKQINAAVRKTRQTETQALADAARETIRPLGGFTATDLGLELTGRINARRIQTGLPAVDVYTMDDLDLVNASQGDINRLLDAKNPATRETAITASEVAREAEAKNIITTDENFATFAKRTTGAARLDRMNQTQLGTMLRALEVMPAQEQPVTLPVVDPILFDDAQYSKAVDGLNSSGRYTFKNLKAAIGTDSNKVAQAVRDAMVERGDLIRSGDKNYRLPQFLGGERQVTPADLPEGVSKVFTVRQVPKKAVKVVKDGKAVGTYSTTSEAQGRVKSIRENETKEGKKLSKVSIEPADGTAYAIFENRYDEDGNFLGQAPVDSFESVDAAAREADKMNRVDEEAPAAPPTPRKPMAPEALQGRVGLVLDAMKDLAEERNLPLLGAKIRLKTEIRTPEGELVEATYEPTQNLIQLAATDLSPDMSTEQIIDVLSQRVDHELIHALREAGVLAPETKGWKTLDRYVRKAKRADTGETYMDYARRLYAGREGYDTEADMVEEAIAEAFRFWAADRRSVAPRTQSVFRQIIAWFKSLVDKVPNEFFERIEKGIEVQEAIDPPGSNLPRATAVRAMEDLRSQAQALNDAEPSANPAIMADRRDQVEAISKEYAAVQAQARENRRGRAAPKTVLGYTPSQGYATGQLADRERIRALTTPFREQRMIKQGPIQAYPRMDELYQKRIANYHEVVEHQPDSPDVQSAYNAMKSEVMDLFKSLGDIRIRAWTDASEPYTNPAEMVNDILDNGNLYLRLTTDMFGPSVATFNHPLYEQSNVSTSDGRTLTYNDIMRVVTEVFGHAQAGVRYNPRDKFVAYHELSRLMSDNAKPALAAETLGQNAWQNYGRHMRRKDQSVPAVYDVDYLKAKSREFAEQKAYAMPWHLIEKDTALQLLRRMDAAESYELGSMARAEKPTKFSLGNKKDLTIEPWGKAKGTYGAHDFFSINDENGGIVGYITARAADVTRDVLDIAKKKGQDSVKAGDRYVKIQYAGRGSEVPTDNTTDYESRLVPFESRIEERDLTPNMVRDMAGMLAEFYPDVKWFLGLRLSGSRTSTAATDFETMDDMYAIIPAEPLVERFKRRRPGGVEYAQKNPSVASRLVKPNTEGPKYAVVRDGNRYFGGPLTVQQVDFVRSMADGSSMRYMTPRQLSILIERSTADDQDAFDYYASRGYKFNTIPSLEVAVDENGVADIVAVDGAQQIDALRRRGVQEIPIIVYPKAKRLDGPINFFRKGERLIPAPSNSEYYPDYVNRPPRYSLKAPHGERVPPADQGVAQFDVMRTRIDGAMGRFLTTLARSKKEIPVINRSIFDLRVKLQDKMLPVKESLEQIRDNGGNVSDAANVYLQEQLYHGRTGEGIRRSERDLFTPVLNMIRDNNKVTLGEVENFMYARHALERNAHLRLMGSPEENPSGMSDQEAQSILDKAAESGQIDHILPIAQRVYDIIEDTNQKRLDYGLISQEAIDQSPYDFYVPLRGIADEDLDPDLETPEATRARSSRGFGLGGKEDVSPIGRKKKAGDILAHTMLQNEEATIRGEKNRVAASMAKLINENPDAGIGTIIPRAEVARKYVRGKNGRIHLSGDPRYHQRPDIITFKAGGEEIVMKIDDPRVARSIKQDYEPISSFVVGALGGFNRYLSMMNTAINPEFLVTNLARDMETAGFVGANYDTKGFGRSILRDTAKSLKGIRQAIRNDDYSTEWAQHFREFQEAGAGVDFLGIQNLESQITRINDGLASLDGSSLAKSGEVFRNVLGFIEDYNKIAENGVRLSAFVNARKMGASTDQAAYLAKNLTVNFNKGGEQKAFMNAMYLFYNASIQGSWVLLNLLRSRTGQKIMGSLLTMGILTDLINSAMTDDDDGNGVNDYDEIPQHVLEHNLVIMDPLGVMEAVGIKRGYIPIPLPYGFNAFYNAGRNLGAVLRGSKVYTPGKAAASTVMGALDSFNPVGGTNSFWNFVSPTFGDWAFDLARNRDFADRPIVPEWGGFGQNVPESQKFWNSTSTPFKWVAENMNELAGGNVIRSSGPFDISPAQMEYMFDYLTGAAGAFARRTVGFVTDVGPEAISNGFTDIDTTKIPMLRKFVGTINNRGNTEFYYDNAKEISIVEDELKHFEEAGDYQMLQNIYDTKPQEIQLIEVFKDSEKQLKALRKQLREIRDSDNIPEDQKKPVEDALQEQMDQIMAIANQTFVQVTEGP